MLYLIDSLVHNMQENTKATYFSVKSNDRMTKSWHISFYAVPVSHISIIGKGKEKDVELCSNDLIKISQNQKNHWMKQNNDLFQRFFKIPNSPLSPSTIQTKVVGKLWLNYFPPSSNYLILTTGAIKWSPPQQSDDFQEISQDISIRFTVMMELTIFSPSFAQKNT